MQLGEVIIKRIRTRLILSLIGAVFACMLVYLANSFWTRLDYVSRIVGISTNIIDYSIESADLDMLIIRLNSLSSSKEVHNLTVFNKTGRLIAGPVNPKKNQPLAIHRSYPLSYDLNLSLDISLFSFLDCVVMGFVFTSLIMIYYLFISMIRTKHSEIIQEISEDLLAIARDEKRECNIDCEEFQFIRNRFNTHLEHLKKINVDLAIAHTVQLVAHDVRKPISMLTMVLDSIRDKLGTSRLDQDFISSSLSKVNSITRQTNHLLSDIIESNTKRELVPSSISTILCDSLRIVFQHETYPNIHLNFCLSQQKKCLADPLRMQRVVVNLLQNALDAIASKPASINISSLQDNEQNIWVRIQNTGSHIVQEYLAHIFDPFFTRGKSKGTGLGLGIAKRIVESGGGKIFCHSSENQVRFEFSLPTCDESDGAEVSATVYEILKNKVGLITFSQEQKV